MNRCERHDLSWSESVFTDCPMCAANAPAVKQRPSNRDLVHADIALSIREGMDEQRGLLHHTLELKGDGYKLVPIPGRRPTINLSATIADAVETNRRFRKLEYHVQILDQIIRDSRQRQQPIPPPLQLKLTSSWRMFWLGVAMGIAIMTLIAEVLS